MTIGLIIAVVVTLMLILYMIRIVPEYQRIVVLRLGRVLTRPKGPGRVLSIEKLTPGMGMKQSKSLVRPFSHLHEVYRDYPPNT